MQVKDGPQKSTEEKRGDAGKEMPGGNMPAGRHQFLQGEVLSRLKKIEGQVRGVYKMIEDQRSCGDIVIQLAAIRAAVNRVGVTVLACHMADNIENDVREGKDIKESLAEFMSMFKKFS